ncbi:MAG TPA: hypothetical protein VLJ37_08840 [bacterium]|nr:hypothetical protein [bacterium]
MSWIHVSETAERYIEHIARKMESGEVSRDQLQAYLKDNPTDRCGMPLRCAGETDDSYAIRLGLIDAAKAVLAAHEAKDKLDGLVKTHCASSTRSPACRYAQEARDALGSFVKTAEPADLAAGMDALLKIPY